ncbi:MAG: haloacid dehalogenase-like hydrolase [Solobacterium sp.]|nr:haloacid dehalogenase-like hydrolase [Solobacterium sp.]
MNVFDFDNTIYRGDSTFGFVRYCYRHYPRTLRSIPRTAWYGLLYGLRIVPKQTFKENLFHMFVYVDDMEEAVESFTTSRLNHIKGWYLQMQEPDDMIISASPQFLIQSFCDKIHIRTVIASPVDPKTGKYHGLNCHGKEKVRKLDELYPGTVIDRFYSDSKSDTPLAERAARAFLVSGDRITDWFPVKDK